MKVLHWSRLILDPDDPADRETIWWDLPEISFDVADFESKFSQKVKASRVAEKDDDGADGSRSRSDTKPAKKEKLKILEPKRSNAVGILISRLPELKVLRTAIRDLDDHVLEREQVDQIRAQLPTSEEAEELQSRDGPDVVWDRPEAFLKMLLSIPRVGPRLRCWSVSRAFDEAADALEVSVEALDAAFAELPESKPLLELLGLLLAYGNHMNGGDKRRGQADGFPIADLMAVCGAKSSVGKHTLLSYALEELTRLAGGGEATSGGEGDADVRAVAADSEPQRARARTALRLEASLPRLRDGCKVSLVEVQAQHAALAKDVREVARITGAEPESSAHQKLDPFKSRMSDFSEGAQARIDKVGEVLKRAEVRMKDARTFFGITASELKDDEILKFFATFADEVKRSMPPPPKPKRAPTRPVLPPLGPINAASSAAVEKATVADPMQNLITAIQLGRPNLRKVGTGEARAGGPMSGKAAANEAREGTPPGGAAGKPASRKGVETAAALSAKGTSMRSEKRLAGGNGEPADAADGDGTVERLLISPTQRSAKGTPSTKAAADGSSRRSGEVTQLDSSLFGHANTSFSRPTAQTARSAIMARIREQESQAAASRLRPAPQAAAKGTSAPFSFLGFGSRPRKLSQARGGAAVPDRRASAARKESIAEVADGKPAEGEAQTPSVPTVIMSTHL